MGNEVRLLAAALRSRGFDSRVFVALRTGREPEPVEELETLLAGEGADVVLYHVATASRATPLLVQARLPLAVVYHNVTPPEFFYGVDLEHYEACLSARRDLLELREAARLAVAHSEFSRGELVEMGYAQTATVPLLVDLARLAGDDRADASTLPTPQGPVLLTVGRVAPHKRLEDCVRLLHALRVDLPEAELWITGDASRLPTYAEAVREVAERLDETAHLRWLGAVSGADLARCYRLASLYVCMSEHEGFGGPLLEAMASGLPVLAHDAGAVAETLGGAGALLPGKDPLLAAQAALQILRDPALQTAMAETGRRRAAALSGEGVVEALLAALRRAGLLRGEAASS